MAIHYNLSKVYSLSENDPEFVTQILTLFVTEVPEDLAEIKTGIKTKNHKHAYAFAHKLKPTLDLVGLNIAFEEILQIEAWAKSEGRKNAIIETYKSIKSQIDNAIKEIKTDFEL